MPDKTNPDPATIPEADVPHAAARMLDESLGLVVIWGPSESALLGAWLPIGSEPKTLGRGLAQTSDPHPRVQALLQRPGVNLPVGPFQSPALSRVQLELCAIDGGIRIKNVGRLPLSINEVACEEGWLEAGDIVQVGNQLLLMCRQRPGRLSTLEGEQQAFGAPDAHGFVGESPAMWQLRQELGFVGARPGHVMVHGESGTGKELAANALHRSSKRNGPLVARNAATFPDTLIDAELFGCAKGFPNPGMPERVGLIGAAQGGTLFLDEFAELPLAQQTRLLRVLDDGEYQRLGESTLRHADVRVVGATNRPLSDLRHDVAARFAFLVRTPSLADRAEDIPLIVRHLLAQVAQDDPELRARFFQADGEARVSAALLTRLVRGRAVGNVRHLRNALWRSLAESPGDTLVWPASVGNDSLSDRPGPPSNEPDPERERIRAALDRNQGSMDKTFRELGLSSRFALNRLLKKYGISLRRSSS